MRKAKVYYDLIDAYEIWTITIPDDAPEDERELKEWLEDSDNQFKWEQYGIWDSGYYEQTLIEVSSVDPKPPPVTPDWWEDVYQDLYKNNIELVEKFKEQYG